ncbi:MAG: T9SS type A sorting domain-containing protein [Flavobacteriales bacterium]|nr:T9SS type A sorting domain-containing protein [Flavobacteriales bacterium]
MKKILLPALMLPMIAAAQMTYTGGPNNLTSECSAIWASGDSALMGYNDGLYRTLDGGQTWNNLTNGIPYNCDPRVIEYTDGKLFVATNNNSRMYTSTDFGNSFIAEGGNLALLSPTAGTSGPGIAMIGGTLVAPSIYNSSTSSWDAVVSGGLTHDIEYLAEDTIWVCSGSVSSGTTRYSHDNGQTWTDVVNEPNTDIGGGIMMNALAKSIAKVGGRIIVGTNLNGFPILYSDDYGTTWTAATASGYGCSQILVVNDNLILALFGGGIQQSTDQGETWTLVNAVSGPMAIWKGDKLLCGNYEFDNYGSGALLKVHGVPGTASNLVPHNGQLLSAVHGNIMAYNPTTAQWSVFQDTNSFGNPLGAKSLFIDNGTYYAVTDNDVFASTDGGVTFQYYDLLSLVNQTKMTFLDELAGKKFLASVNSSASQKPRINYSTDGGVTYTNTTFSNNISYGLYGAGANFVENILDAGNNVLVADFNAGYAISSDGGLNWTFSGGTWDQSWMTVSGSTIYNQNTNVQNGTKTFKKSTDGGATWQNVSMTGLPNSGGANYNGFYGAALLNGKVCTYNVFHAPRGIYELNESAGTWSLVANTDCLFEDWDGVTELSYHVGSYYANWFLNGTYTSESIPGAGIDDFFEAIIKVYPNPSSGVFRIETEEPQMIRVYDLFGKMVYQNVEDENEVIDLSACPVGVYLLKVGNSSGMIKLIKY